MERLSRFAHLQGQPRRPTLDKIEGVEVVVRGAEMTEGRMGPYVIIEIEGEDGEPEFYQCSGKFVVDAFEEAIESDAFPCKACFIRSGKAWIVT